jgi:hypothetical protein
MERGIYYSRAGATGLDEMLAASRGDLAAGRVVIRRDAADQSFLNWFAAGRVVIRRDAADQSFLNWFAAGRLSCGPPPAQRPAEVR